MRGVPEPVLGPPPGVTREVLGVTIEDGPVPPPWDAAIVTHRLCADAYRFRLQNGPVALYVENGDRVVIEAPDAETRLLYDFFAYATAPRALLWQRHRYNLHATLVVSPEGRAVAIMGHSMAGKSTTTIELMRRGWTFGCDDVVEVDMADDRAVAVPLARPIHLSDRAAGLLGADLAMGRPLPWPGKRVFALESSDRAVELAALVHLQADEGEGEVSLSRLDALGSLSLVGAHSDTLGVCQLPEHRADYLRWTAAAVGRVGAWRVTRPRDSDSVSCVGDAVEESMRL